MWERANGCNTDGDKRRGRTQGREQGDQDGGADGGIAEGRRGWVCTVESSEAARRETVRIT